MGVPYDVFTQAFLDKVTEYDFPIGDYERNGMVDRYMKRAISQFRHICLYDFTTTADDLIREFDVDVADDDLDELVEIISEGMTVQWMKPYLNKQDNLQLLLNTRDFTAYSPAEMLNRIKETYMVARKNFINMMKEYSYNHGDLTELHL